MDDIQFLGVILGAEDILPHIYDDLVLRACSNVNGAYPLRASPKDHIPELVTTVVTVQL